MKKIIFAAIMAIFGLSINAQIVYSRSSMITKEKTQVPGYNMVYFQWNPSKIKYDGTSYDFTGLTLGYNRGISLAPNTPLFLEVGGAAQYSFGDEYDEKINFVSVKVPINLTYNWEISDMFAIAPYAGLTARFNIWGRGEYKGGYYGGGSYNLFSSDEGDCKRFQVGWQVGANFKFNKKFYIGASYGTDFNKFGGDDGKIHTTSITAGIIF